MTKLFSDLNSDLIYLQTLRTPSNLSCVDLTTLLNLMLLGRGREDGKNVISIEILMEASSELEAFTHKICNKNQD